MWAGNWLLISTRAWGLDCARSFLDAASHAPLPLWWGAWLARRGATTKQQPFWGYRGVNDLGPGFKICRARFDLSDAELTFRSSGFFQNRRDLPCAVKHAHTATRKQISLRIKAEALKQLLRSQTPRLAGVGVFSD